jgi:hypothetical protein
MNYATSKEANQDSPTVTEIFLPQKLTDEDFTKLSAELLDIGVSITNSKAQRS